jgi:hypothetical protein
MKSIILGSVSTAALLFASAAFADGNSSTITQIGTSQNAIVDQTQSSGGAVAQITQGLADADANNAATVTQGGSGAQASVTQSQGGYGVAAPSNTSTSDQEGAGDNLTVVQVGNNTSSIAQTSNSVGEYALVGQSNNFNSSTIVQAGQSEFALVNQEEGTGNNASISQSGTGAGNVTPVGSDRSNIVPGPGDLVLSENVPGDSVLPGAPNLTRYGVTGAAVDQVGSNNIGAVSQQGTQNFADVSQENDTAPGGNIGTVIQGSGVSYSDGVMYQLGQNNIASINQSGGGSTYSTIWQNGNSNQAYSTQVGSNVSEIAQGQNGASAHIGNIPDPGSATPVNNDYASVTQGGGDTSLVNQTGNNDNAQVSQQAANATSTVTQGGSFNVAVVRQ